MRHVDHDPRAARAAAARCREAAGVHDRVASWLQATPPAVAWSGGERTAVVARAAELGDELRREAASLRQTATLLDAAASAAERREHELALAAAREAIAGASVPCPPATARPTAPTRPTVAASHPTARRSGAPSGAR